MQPSRNGTSTDLFMQHALCTRSLCWCFHVQVTLPAKSVATAVAFVTAQQSPYCNPDARLVTNDYGSCAFG